MPQTNSIILENEKKNHWTNCHGTSLENLSLVTESNEFELSLFRQVNAEKPIPQNRSQWVLFMSKKMMKIALLLLRRKKVEVNAEVD